MIGLYFGGGQFNVLFGNQYGNIELDATLEESHEWVAEATRNPVENGAPIADHIIEWPDQLKIRGFVSDTPLTASQSVQGVVNSGQVGNRTQNTFELLHQLIKLKQTMTVYTKHKVYDDMVLTVINIPRSSADGEAIEFTAEFIHIRKVASQTVDVPKGISAKEGAKSSKSLSRKTQAQKNAGKVQTETFDIYKNRSMAKRLLDMSQGKNTGPEFKGRKEAGTVDWQLQ